MSPSQKKSATETVVAPRPQLLPRRPLLAHRTDEQHRSTCEGRVAYVAGFRDPRLATRTALRLIWSIPVFNNLERFRVRVGMKSKSVAALVVLAGTTLGVEAAERPSAGAQFEGLWQVERMPRLGRIFDQTGRPLGFDADDIGHTAGDYRVRGLMTEAGQAEFDKFDPSELPANNCISPGLPLIASASYLQEWKLDGDNLRITHEHYSTKRTIHLDTEAPEDLRPTRAGYATGSFDDNSLVVKTTGLTATFGGLSRNAPSSDARVVTERYQLLEDGTMELQIAIEDEKFLTQPLQMPVRIQRAEPGAELILFPCDVEAARRHLED